MCTRRLILLFGALLTAGGLTPMAVGQTPAWWGNSQFTVSGTSPAVGGTANDYAAVNQGQLKNIAITSVNELNTDLAQFGGAGPALDAMELSLSSSTAHTSDFSVVNLGQLKALAKPFFDQLFSIGFSQTTGPLSSGTYPWANSVTPPNDYAIANIGQVKNLFDFDVTYSSEPGNPLPDWWQLEFVGHLGVNPWAQAGSNGQTYWMEYLDGTYPAQYYGGGAPVISIAGGNNQTGGAGAYLGEPLLVNVTDSYGNPLSNVPVVFTLLQSGSGGLSVNGLAMGSYQTAITDDTGDATVQFMQPDFGGITTQIDAIAGNAAPVTFTEYTSPVVGYWEFNDGGGTIASDSSGAGNTGALQGGANWGTGFDGSGGLALDGTDAYVSVAPSNSLNVIGGAFTFSAWVQLAPGVSLISATNVFDILSSYDSSGAYIEFALSGGSNSGIFFSASDGQSNYAISSSSSVAATLANQYWHFVAFTEDGNGNGALYVDGSEVASQSGFPTDIALLNVDTLWIGQNNTGPTFDGSMDNVQISVGALSGASILADYNVDSNGDGLPDWWEWQYFGTISLDPSADPTGNGLTILQDYQEGLNPTDYYSGQLPTLTIAAGATTLGEPAQITPQALQVEVTGSSGQPLTNAPVQAVVTSGSAQITIVSQRDPVTSGTLNLMTDDQGYVQFYVLQPPVPSAASAITVSAQSSGRTASVIFNTAALDTVVDPTLGNSGGTFSNAQTVTVTCATPTATIYYTLDGTVPTQGSSIVTSGSTVAISQTETLTVKAIATGMNPSDSINASFTIGD
jgi:hypothetical protein